MFKCSSSGKFRTDCNQLTNVEERILSMTEGESVVWAAVYAAEWSRMGQLDKAACLVRGADTATDFEIGMAAANSAADAVDALRLVAKSRFRSVAVEQAIEIIGNED
jgi:phosphopantetheine adenylyltransferase